jgi:hypothetical protein
MLIVGTLLLGAPLLIAQVPASERIPIRDPDRLEALGFPRDAANVSVWSRLDLGTGRAPDTASARPSEPETWGTGLGYSTVSGYELEEVVPKLTTFWNDLSLGTYCYEDSFVSAPIYAYARIPIPEGVRLKSFRSWAYDADPDVDLQFQVYETCQPYGYDPPAVTLIAENQTVAAIGQYPGLKSLNDLTVNNRICTYTVRVAFAPDGECRGPTLRVQQLQFSWARQVSPAPAFASFADVPTSHPFYQHIEALFDSGITGGCSASPLMYCPERPITRGEMAVFLAKALGLSWP